MKLTHFLLAACVALPTALTGCDASGPDSAGALALSAAPSQARATVAGEKNGGPIQGPTSITVGPIETYSRYGAIDMSLKGTGGTAEIVDEYSINDSEGVPTRYLKIRGLTTGGIQIEAVHPNFGKSTLGVTITEPPVTCTAVGSLNGPVTLDLNETATFSASCANLLDVVDETGTAMVVTQSITTDPQGRPTVTGTVKATGVGTVRVRAFNGSLVRAKRVTISGPTTTTCDLSFSSEGGIWGPKSIRAGDTGTFSAYGAIGMSLKLTGGVATATEYSVNDPDGVPTRYLDVSTTSDGGIQIRATFPNSTGSRNVTICPGPVFSE